MCRERVKLPQKKSAEQALASLMRQCARAEKSSGDAKRLMARWGVELQDRDKVLAELVDNKFIDDRRFAEAYAREKLNLSGWGGRKIAASLRVKGVANTIIEETLNEVDSAALKDKLATKMLRKAGSIKYKDNYDKRGKLIRYGLSLGYDYDMVLDAVSQNITIEDE